MTTIVTIDMGGTGATHAAGAREALSVPSMEQMGHSYAQANNARDQANAAYAAANTAAASSVAYDQANTARTQANTARTQANNAYAAANTAQTTAQNAYAEANTAETIALNAYGQANSARDQANTARTQANTAYGQANAAYGAANTRLSASGGTLSGDLIITGNLTVSGNQTILNTEVLTTEDADIVLLSNTSSTPALNAGLIVNRGSSTNTFLRWNETLDEWGWSDSGTTTYYFEDLRQGLSTTNTTFGTINTSLGTINTSLGTINTNYQAAYAQANTAGTNALNAYGQANAARSDANTTFATINTTFATLNTSAGTQNTAITTANDQANTARSQANTARDTANSSYGQANTATTNAGNAYGTANTAATNALNAYGQANTARTTANDAYAAANTKLASSSYTASDVLSKLLTVDGASSGLDADLLDGQHGSYYATKSFWPDATTQLGASTHGLTVFNTTALWSQPAGYETMVNATGSSGLPTSHGQSYFGYLITSRRDTGGGYSALLTAYDNSQLWFTYNGTNTGYPTWNKIWHENNDGSGSGLDADLWDGYQFTDYLNQAVKTTSSPTFSNMTVTGYFTNIRNNASVSPPSTSDHSLGTRLTLYDATATSWYAIGIESDTMWFNSDNQYKWYVDAVQRMILDSSGNLTASGRYYGNITSSGSGDSNAPFIFNADYSGWASHWAGTPGSNNGWGLFWAGNSGAQYGTNGTGGPGNIWSNSANPNEAVFVGNGSTDWTIQLNGGNVWQKGHFYCAGDVYTSYSDKRLKDIIGPITNAVEKIKKIDTIYYTANELAKSLGVQEKGVQVGVTSQSVKEVLPEVVVQSPVNIDYETVQYERIVPLLIAAIKEQQEQIEELKKKLGV